jgi:hypothetical protein
LLLAGLVVGLVLVLGLGPGLVLSAAEAVKQGMRFPAAGHC